MNNIENDFMEYLFTPEVLYGFYGIEGHLNSLKRSKDEEIKDGCPFSMATYTKDFKIKSRKFLIDHGWFGNHSFFVYINKNDKEHIVIRISYHAPDENGWVGDYGYEKKEERPVGILSLDILSAEDEEKAYQRYQIIKKSDRHGTNKVYVKAKKWHKKFISLHSSKTCQYVDLGTDDFSQIMDAVKAYIKSKLTLDEMQNYKDFSVYYGIEYDE
jgi:hypothetical protein